MSGAESGYGMMIMTRTGKIRDLVLALHAADCLDVSDASMRIRCAAKSKPNAQASDKRDLVRVVILGSSL